MNSVILFALAVALVLAGIAFACALVSQREPKRVPVRRLPAPGARRER